MSDPVNGCNGNNTVAVRWLGVVATLALVLAAGIFVATRPAPRPPPAPPTKPQPVGQTTPPGHATGWVDDPAAVQAVVAGLPIQDFRNTPAYKAAQGDEDHVYLWDMAVKVLGKHIPTRNQGQVGSCVSFGWSCGAEYCQAAQIATGRAEKFRDVCQECVYGGSRVQIGGGKIRGDGSVGAWAADWVSKYGIIPRDKYPGYDLTAYSESTCRSFGSKGCPKDLESVAKEHPVKSVAPIRSAAELKKALLNYYPVPVCSNQGFSRTRDADGFAKPQGNWGHCMAFIGYRSQPKVGFYIMNSWGETWISGPAGPGNPPPGGFWCDEATADRMLKANDSFACSDLNGFPVRRLDWVRHEFPRRALPVRESLFALAH